MFVIITGCPAGSVSTLSYYEKIDKEGNLSEEKIYFSKFDTKNHTKEEIEKNYEEVKNKKNTNRFGKDYKRYCVYYLGLIIPLNFWDFNKTRSQIIQRAIKDFNDDGYRGNSMKDILFFQEGSGLFPIFYESCEGISAGTLMQE